MEIIEVSASEMVEKSLLEYGETTIKQRVIPDFRDGLKPVHRRILYAMYSMGVLPNKGLKKSAAIVGETLAKYHPHSDVSVFKTLVNLVQERYPLVFGSGNWGDEYSESAASRYIDCRLADLSMQLFEYIEVAKYADNYSGEFKEPMILPSKIPLLLMNGTSGIAVGVSVDIPSHNLKELVDALIYLIKEPEAETRDLLVYIKGPDYGLGGVLVSSEEELLKVYETGKGALTYRCQYRLVICKDKKVLEVFNYSPRFDEANFIHKCEDLVEKGLLDYINNDSAEGIFKLSIGYSNSSIIEEKVLPQLYNTITYHFYITERQEDDKVLFRATDLKSLMLDWLDYQRSIRIDYYNHILNKLSIELMKNSTRLFATNHIDKVAEALKAKDSLNYLMEYLNISEVRAKYILSLQVGALTKISANEQKKKINQLKGEIIEYKNKLANLDIEIVKDLQGLSRFFDPRRTLVREPPPELCNEDNLWVSYVKGLIKQVSDYTKIKNANAACLVSKGGFYIIDEGGTAVRWKLLEEIKLYPNTFECISGDYQYLCVIDVEGNIAILNLFKIKKKEFVTLRTNSKLIRAVGFNDNDKLLITNSKERKLLKVPEDIIFCKTSSKGFRIFKDKITSLEVISPEDLILDEQGQQILIENLKNEQGVIVLGEYNLVDGTVINRKKALHSCIKKVKKLR
jgi:DNA gyrase/topoisomerase IV subunit A